MNESTSFSTEEEKSAAEAHKARVTAAVKEQEAQLAATRKELDTHVNSNRRAGCVALVPDALDGGDSGHIQAL